MMICESCAKGAEFYIKALEVANASPYRMYARKFHEQCKGCDCQHKSNVKIGIDWTKLPCKLNETFDVHQE